MTQAAQILEALKRGRVLTPLDALHEFGCFRLAARVGELRDAGYRVVTTTRSQNGKRYAEYRLDERE